jgi:phospholipase/carboxylesterase
VTGLHRLGLWQGCDGLLDVPANYQPPHPSPVVLMLHGAGATGLNGQAPLMPFAEQAGL